MSERQRVEGDLPTRSDNVFWFELVKKARVEGELSTSSGTVLWYPPKNKGGRHHHSLFRFHFPNELEKHTVEDDHSTSFDTVFW